MTTLIENWRPLTKPCCQGASGPQGRGAGSWRRAPAASRPSSALKADEGNQGGARTPHCQTA
eukprot:4291422-Pyramimonas_sp.AAC.1